MTIKAFFMYSNLLFIDMEINIPQSLKIEHEELHNELRKAIKYGGKLGDAAKAVANVLHDHFIKEEEYALPPLGLLSFLSQGKFTSEMKEIVTMTDKLKLTYQTWLKNTNRLLRN
jgi:hypothetical protein